ncbi:MAG: CRISPR system precrRNA processing endoribonuclease RAMP protein Cas6 [Campylobacterota bacterium]|nr:CRISPR system precrRNA processing endoribonuclease RAMP protein Cas6 [Campylobacterota bacterium]
MNFTKISLIIKANEKPPYFIGSQLRGALGYALKKVTCINPSFQCEGCFAISNCLYYEFYEEKNIFHKYRFDFELGKEYYDFSFYLFGDAVQKLPYVVSAFHMMLTQNGLGKDRIKYKNFDMFINDEACMINNQLKLPQDFVKKVNIDKISQNISIKFITPLRIKKENKFIRGENLELKDIINSIYQRQMKLLGYEHKKFPYEIKGEVINRNLNYKELTRLSNRQKTTMNLGGIMGKMEIKDLNKECYEVLKIGELLAVGKQTVFGLGKIQIEDMK